METDNQVINGESYEEIEQEQETEQETEEREPTPYERQLFARLKKEEAKNKELKYQVANNQYQSDPERLDRIEMIAKGYDEEDIDYINSKGGIHNLQDEFFLDMLKARKDKLELRKKAVSGVSSKSGVQKTYSERDISKMSSEEYARSLGL